MKKKVLVLGIILIGCCSFAAFAESTEKTYTINPENLFSITPPAWIQGFWDSSEGDQHAEITSDSIFTDFMSPHSRPAELGYYVLSCILNYGELVDETGKIIIKNDHNSIDYSDSAILTLTMFSMDELVSMTRYYLSLEGWNTKSNIQAGLEEILASMVTESILDQHEQEVWQEIYTFYNTLYSYTISQEYTYDGFFRLFAELLPSTKFAYEYIEHISVKEISRYPYYEVQFTYDSFPLATIIFYRSGNQLQVSERLYTWPARVYLTSRYVSADGFTYAEGLPFEGQYILQECIY